MDLGTTWAWHEKKLACKIRAESGNPAIDELRLRLSEMAGVPIPDAMASGSGKKAGGTVGSKKLARKGSGLEKDKPAASIPLASLGTGGQIVSDFDSGKTISKTNMNIHKKFFVVPRSPPPKIIADMHLEKMKRPEIEIEGFEARDGTQPMDAASLDKLERRRQKRAQREKLSKRSAIDKTRKQVDSFEEIPVDTDKVFKPYKGDTFGTKGNYMGGMVYLSRLPPQDMPNLAPGSNIAPKRLNAKNADIGKQLAVDEAAQDYAPEDSDSLKAREAKLHCAGTLASWAQHDANTDRLAKEGAVQATMVLCKEEDIEIRKHCANAFRHMSSKRALCEQLVKSAAVSTISELASSPSFADKGISRDCAICLVNMTRMDGIEARLVEDGIVLALMSLMNQHDDLAALCVRGLFNLTCVDQSYQFVERVIKSFVQLASSATLEVKHICVSGLCNLSDLKSLRPRIVEEGVVQALQLLARQAESKTRRVCAIILHSLALSSTCRADMVSKGAVLVLHQLSLDEDTITLHYIASAIIRLAMENQHMNRLINDRGVISLCNICQRCPTIASTTQLCAAALQLLSQRTIGKPGIVQEGVVPALVTLLRESKDTTTLRHGLAALCNLLTAEENHLQIINQGGVHNVINLCEHEHSGIQEACALALFNLSRGESTRDHSINSSAIPAIIRLSRLPMPVTQMRCAASLCKLAVNAANVPLMLSEGVVPAFIEMLKTEDAGIVKHCCSALCCLAHEGSSCVAISEGAVPYIINGAQTGDVTTQQACCAVLSIISSHEQCRRQLCDMGALPALIQLAKMNDMKTRLRCAVAFANLSYESTVQGLMVDHDVVPVIADLSSPSPSHAEPWTAANEQNYTAEEEKDPLPKDHDSSYSEENQLYCAKALCNLGCHIGSEKRIVEQGGAYTLMMICMLRAGNQFTKQVCAKALLNLLTPENLEKLVNEDLVQAASALSKRPLPPKNDDEKLLRVCAEIFCFLSASEFGRSKLIKRATLMNIFNLTRSTDRITQSICGKTACNLLSFRDSQAAAVGAGAVSVLKQMCTLGDPASERECSDAFFLISGEESYRREIRNSQVLPVLILLARSKNRDTRWSCNRILCNLAFYESSRKALLETGTIPAVVALAHESEGDDDIIEICLYTVAYLSLEPEYQTKMVEDGVVGAIKKIWHSKPGNVETLKLVALTLRSLSESPSARQQMIADGSMELLAEVATAASESDSDLQEETFPHCATTLYNFACCHLNNNEEVLVAQGALATLRTLGGEQSCCSMVAATLYLLSLVENNREKLAEGGIPELLLKLAEVDDESTVQNCSGTFFMLSKSTHIRETLVDLGMVPTLIRLSKSTTEKVRMSCSEALKNLSSSGGDGIEEGTVSTLISMSLSGANSSTTTIMDEKHEHEIPLIPDTDVSKVSLPDHLMPCFDAAFEAHSTTILKREGLGAGQGPAPPEPPAMETRDEAPLTIEDEDGMEAGGEEDEMTDKIMMFAKMHANESELMLHNS